MGHEYDHKSPLKEAKSKARDGTTEAETGMLSFEDGGEAMNGGIKVASRSWKGQGNESPWEPMEGTCPGDALTLTL